MTPSNPIIINDETYPFYSITLSVLTNYSNNKEIGNIAFKATPTRLDENGNGICNYNEEKIIALTTQVSVEDPEKTAIEKISQAIQEYIIAKNL